MTARASGPCTPPAAAGDRTGISCAAPLKPLKAALRINAGNAALVLILLAPAATVFLM